jgi:hypothetical protein
MDGKQDKWASSTSVTARQEAIALRAHRTGACGDTSGGWTCTRRRGHAGKHETCETPGSVALAVWGDPGNEGASADVLAGRPGGPWPDFDEVCPPASTADGGDSIGKQAAWARAKVLDELRGLGFQSVDVRLTDSGHDFLVSLDAMTGFAKLHTSAPGEALEWQPRTLLERLGHRLERRRLRNRLGEVSMELCEFAVNESHNAEVRGRLGPAGAIPEQRALGKADGFMVAADLVSRVIEELR